MKRFRPAHVLTHRFALYNEARYLQTPPKGGINKGPGEASKVPWSKNFHNHKTHKHTHTHTYTHACAASFLLSCWSRLENLLLVLGRTCLFWNSKDELPWTMRISPHTHTRTLVYGRLLQMALRHCHHGSFNLYRQIFPVCVSVSLN